MVQYQDVHAARRRDRGLRQPVHGLAGSDVRDNAGRARGTVGPQCCRRFIQPSLVAPADRYSSAFLRQGVRDRAAQSFGPAHHECPAVLQSEIHGLLPRSLTGIIGGTREAANDPRYLPHRFSVRIGVRRASPTRGKRLSSPDTRRRTKRRRNSYIGGLD